jgi:thiamine transport system permease protein
MNVRARGARLALACFPAALFVALFYLYPLLRIGQISFTPGDLSQGQTPLTVLADPAVGRVLLFSLGQAALSTVLTLAIGLPAAYVFARFDFPGRAFWRALAVAPFVLPTVVTATAFTALLGPNGWLGLDLTGTLGAILIAHVFYNTGVVVRIVGAFIAALDPQIDEAAGVDGAGRWRTFVSMTLPLALPAVAAAAALVFLFCFASFGVVLLLGGVRFATVEVEIYRQTADLLRLDVATSLALLQLLVTLIAGLVSARLQQSATADTGAGTPRRAPRGTGDIALVTSVVLVLAVGVLLPLFALALRSINPDDVFGFYTALGRNTRNSAFFFPAWVAIGNSLGYALLTTLACVMLGLPLAFAMARDGRIGRAADALLLLPIGTSALTLGLGFFTALGPLRTSPWLLPLAHTVIALPFFVRAIAPALRALDPQLREAASTEGASRWRIARAIELPLIGPSLGAAAMYAFSLSLGEFGASLLISRPEFPTLTVAIFRFLGQPGALNYGQAMALSTLLMLIMLLAARAIDRLDRI